MFIVIEKQSHSYITMKAEPFPNNACFVGLLKYQVLIWYLGFSVRPGSLVQLLLT